MTRPGWVSDDEIRDLGFGAVVARESRQREVVWGAKFGDILHHPRDTEAISLDVSRLDSIEPVP